MSDPADCNLIYIGAGGLSANRGNLSSINNNDTDIWSSLML